MMKTTSIAMIAVAATLSFVGAAAAEDFPATPMNAGPPTIPMMQPERPMMAPAPEPAMEKPMTKRQKRMMMKKKMMEQQQ